MDPELKSLLTETLALSKDNHRMLRALRRAQVWGFIGKVVFWILVLVAPLYFLAPYLSSFPSAAQFEQVLNTYQGKF